MLDPGSVSMTCGGSGIRFHDLWCIQDPFPWLAFNPRSVSMTCDRSRIRFHDLWCIRDPYPWLMADPGNWCGFHWIWICNSPNVISVVLFDRSKQWESASGRICIYLSDSFFLLRSGSSSGPALPSATKNYSIIKSKTINIYFIF